MYEVSLDTLKPGDPVLISERNGLSKGTLQSITPAGNYKVSQKTAAGIPGETTRIFNKSGWERGCGTWSLVSLRVFDKTIWENEIQRRKRIKLLLGVDKVLWRKLPNEALEKILEIVNASQKEETEEKFFHD